MLATHPQPGRAAAPRARRTLGLGDVLAQLAAVSARPRYAFLVLGLVAEAAGEGGRAGPFVDRGAGPVALRDWIAAELMPVSARGDRRGALRRRVIAALGAKADDPAFVEDAVEEEALAVGKTNVSRAVSDLVRAGLVRRHYAGRITDHANRGGRRLAVYTVDAEVLAAVRTRATLV